MLDTFRGFDDSLSEITKICHSMLDTFRGFDESFVDY
jgi:hypothetical protein